MLQFFSHYCIDLAIKVKLMTGALKMTDMKMTDMKMQDMFQVSEYVRRH